jgi:WD40 repeat protein
MQAMEILSVACIFSFNRILAVAIKLGYKVYSWRMFFRSFLCVLLFGIAASAQPPLPRLPSDKAKLPAVKVAASPNGQTIAVARSSGGSTYRLGQVELWNSATGKLERTINGFDGPIWSLTFSPDGQTLITVSTEIREKKIQTDVKDRARKVYGELKWWNAQTGEFIKKLPLAEEGIGSLEAAWSPNGNVLALVERFSRATLMSVPERGAFNQQVFNPGWVIVEEVEIKLLDAQTGERSVKVEDASRSYQGYHSLLFARIERPVFSPDGKTLAAVVGGEVVLWNVDTGRKVLTLKKVHGVPTALVFSPDSRTIAVAGTKGRMPGGESQITVWEAPSGREVNRLKGKNDEITSLQFVAQGRALLIGSLQYEIAGAVGTVKMWDMRENRLGRFNVREGKAVSSLLLLADQSFVVQSDEEVELRDAKTWEVKYTLEPSDADEDESLRRSRFILTAKRAVAVAFSHDGTSISAEIPGEGIRQWDSRTGGLENKIPSDRALDTAVAMSANGDFRAEPTKEGVRLTNVVQGTSEEFKVSGDGPIAALALSSDGQLLAVATGDQITVLKAADKSPAVTFDVGLEITAVAIHPSGQSLAVARADRSIVFWSLKTGSMQGELRKHQAVINALAFSPDGRMLASGGDDRTAILWEVASRKSKRRLKGHDVTVTSLAFSPDGRLLASGSGNAAVVLWNVSSGKLDRILR